MTKSKKRDRTPTYGDLISLWAIKKWREKAHPRGALVKVLSSAQIQAALTEIPQWTLGDNKISRSFKFVNFVEAFTFMSAIAEHAEAQNHHPNWSNVYNTVDITLWTHDLNGLSEKDFILAKTIDEIANCKDLQR